MKCCRISSLIFEAEVPRNDPILCCEEAEDAESVVGRHENDLLVHSVLGAVLFGPNHIRRLHKFWIARPLLMVVHRQQNRE